VNVLLIRLRLIGDVVFTTPAVRALRRRFPRARLAYLVEPEAAPVVRHNPHLDEIIVAPRPTGRARLTGDLALASRLRRAHYDLVIDFHGGPRSSWLAWASGAPRRIGYAVRARGWMYTERVPRARELRPRHSVENQWDLLTPLGIGPPDRRGDPTEMPEDPAAARAVAARLDRAGITGTCLIVLHVSAGNPFRRWPAPSFADLVARLAAADPDRRVVVISGPSESAAAGAIGDMARQRLAPAARDRVAHLGEFDLAELRALVGRAALFVGGDSGPLHVAGTTRTPIVGLFGPTLSARSAPWRDPELVSESVELEGLACRPCEQQRCAPGDFRCLAHLTVDRVAAAAGRAVAAGGPGG
jgi:heptosyltransferase-1